MLRRIRRQMFPITMSRGLQIVQNLTNPSSDTAKWYQVAVDHFVNFHDDCLVTDVTIDIVRAWSESLDKTMSANGTPYSEWTKNSYRRAIRAYFNKLLEAGHIHPPGPVHRFKVPNPPKNQPRHLTEEEVERIRHYAKVTPREHAMIEILYDTGCRISELDTMRLSNLVIDEYSTSEHLSPKEKELIEFANQNKLDYVLKKGFLTRFRGKVLVYGKGQHGKKKVRWVYFGNSAAVAVGEYIKTRPHGAGDKLWLTYDGFPLSPNSYYHVFKKVARAAGVEARPHDMRHTFAYRLIRNGADAKVVQELLGHSDLTTTMNVYYNLSDEELWKAYDEFTNK